ncbi:MAG: HEPN domain-containing protein [Methylococcales bacterium]|nr:HEPN domain-containing protein [Methylococcales bacterium]
MNNFLLRTESVLNDCKEHLATTDNLDSAIANYLMQYISIIFCAEMEQAVKTIFNRSLENRISNLSDEELKEFINNQLIRLKSSSLKKSDLADYIKSFSQSAKERFNSQLQDKDREISVYSSVVTSRHSVAHTSIPNQVTFLELEQAVEAAKEILEAVQVALQSC